MSRFLRQILLLLVAFALVGGMTNDLAHAAPDCVAMATTKPCDMPMPASASGDTKPMHSDKSAIPDCMKQMGCTAASILPARLQTQQVIERHGPIDYWMSTAELASLDHQPEPLPPRTI
jgi:hypothetical protein